MTTEIITFRVHPFRPPVPLCLPHCIWCRCSCVPFPLRPRVRLPLRVPLLRPSSFAFFSSLFRPLPLPFENVIPFSYVFPSPTPSPYPSPAPVPSPCPSPSPIRCLSPYVLLFIAYLSPSHS